MRRSIRIAMLTIAPVLDVAAETGWLNPDHSEPAGTHYKTFPSRLAAEMSAIRSTCRPITRRRRRGAIGWPIGGTD